MIRPGARASCPGPTSLWGAVGLGYAATFMPGGPRGPRQALLLTTALGGVANSVWAVSSLWRAYRRSAQPQIRQQVLISGLGFGLGIILPFLSMSSYIVFRPYPAVWWSPGEIVGQRPVADWLLPLPLQLLAIATVLPGLITVAILRYQVFSAKTALVKAVAGTLLLGSVVVAYVASVYLFQFVFRVLRLDRVLLQAFSGRGDPAWASHLLATLTTASLFGPLRDRIRSLTLELLYPYRVDLATAVRRLMEAVRGDGDRAPASAWRLPGVVARALERVLHLRTAQVWFYTAVHGELQRVDCRAERRVERPAVPRAGLPPGPSPGAHRRHAGRRLGTGRGAARLARGEARSAPRLRRDELVGLVALRSTQRRGPPQPGGPGAAGAADRLPAAAAEERAHDSRAAALARAPGHGGGDGAQAPGGRAARSHAAAARLSGDRPARAVSSGVAGAHPRTRGPPRRAEPAGGPPRTCARSSRTSHRT